MDNLIHRFMEDVNARVTEKLAVAAAEVSNRYSNNSNPPEAGGGSSGLSVDLRGLFGGRSNYNTGYSGYQNPQVAVSGSSSNYNTGYSGYGNSIAAKTTPAVSSRVNVSTQTPVNGNIQSAGVQPQLLINNQEFQDSLPPEASPYSNPDSARVIPNFKLPK